MPTVPRYGGGGVGPRLQQTLAALPPAYQDIRASVEMFGAGRARALEAAGVGLGNLGDTVGAIAEDQLRQANEAAAGKARAALNDYITESLYGAEGFLGREGEAAVGGYPQQQADFDRRVRELQDGLPTAEAQRLFRETTQDRVLQARRAAAQHAGSQRSAVQAQTVDAELASATGMALKVYDDPEMLREALSQAAGIIRRHNAGLGLAEAAADDQIAGFNQGVFDRIVGQVAERDPGRIAALAADPSATDAPVWWQSASDEARASALAGAERRIDDQRLLFRTDLNRRLKAEIDSHRRGIAVSAEMTVTRADLEAAYDPDQAERLWQDLKRDRAFGDLARAVAMRDPASVQAMLDEARSAEGPEAGGIHGRYHQLRKAVLADRQARQTDPAGYVITHSAGLQSLWGMDGPGGRIGDLAPDEMHSAMQATWEAQAEIGIPMSDRRAMPDATAAAFAKRWLKETDPEVQLDGLLAGFFHLVDEADSARRFTSHLVDAGLPPEISQVLEIAQHPLRRQSAIAALQALAKPMPSLTDSQEREVASAVRATWANSTGPWRRLKALAEADQVLLKDTFDQAGLLDRLTRQELFETTSVSAAAEAAGKTLFGSMDQQAKEALRLVEKLATRQPQWLKQAGERLGDKSLEEIVADVSEPFVTLPELLGIAETLTEAVPSERPEREPPLSSPEPLAPGGSSADADGGSQDADSASLSQGASAAPDLPAGDDQAPSTFDASSSAPEGVAHSASGAEPQRSQGDIEGSQVLPSPTDTMGTPDAAEPLASQDDTSSQSLLPAGRMPIASVELRRGSPDYEEIPRLIEDSELHDVLNILRHTPGAHRREVIELMRDIVRARTMYEWEIRELEERIDQLKQDRELIAVAAMLGHRLGDLIGGEHYRFPALMTNEELEEYLYENDEIYRIADTINIVTDSFGPLKYGSVPITLASWVSSLVSRRYSRHADRYRSELLYRRAMLPQ